MKEAGFTASAEAEELRSSILVIVDFLLRDDRVHKKHQRKFLDRCLWQLTEAEGKHKYDLRYVSAGARPVLESGTKKGLRHEHVWRRADMVKRLLAQPEQTPSILDKACGCVVTIAEHKKLDEIDRSCKDIDGWERYRMAGIKVFDRLDSRLSPTDMQYNGNVAR
jgi:hypothetical protein